jgi:crossover junction endonuclease MUS81
VPTLRSGPYAIFLALSTLPEHSTTGLTKGQVIELAQSHCDASFTAPSDVSKFYTAWNSIKTLQTKDLIYEFGRPTRKYALTEDGWEIAKGMRRGMGTGLSTSTLQFAPKDGAHAAVASASIVTSTTAVGNQPPPRSFQPSFPSSHYAIDLGSDSEDTPQPRAFQYTQSGQGYIPPSDQEEGLLGRRGANGISKAIPDADFVELLSSPPENQLARNRGAVKPRRPLKESEFASNRTKHGDEIWGTGASASTSRTLKPATITTTDIPAPKPPSLQMPNAVTGEAPFKSIVIPPGEFTVELLLDNREVRSKTDRDYIQTGLSDRGVKPITRALELGDAMWVAKPKDPRFLPRHGEEDTEVVLDWIVERKRLDDLISSVKDGRFQEQKYRMRKSGVKNVVYIIEHKEIGSDTEYRCHDMVRSAIAATQVQNGYFVKQTAKLDDTIRYLARMTTMLKVLYEVRLLSAPTRTTQLTAASPCPSACSPRPQSPPQPTSPSSPRSRNRTTSPTPRSRP